MVGIWGDEATGNSSLGNAQANPQGCQANSKGALHLRVGTIVWAPFVMRSYPGSNATYSGVYMEFLQYIAEEMDFTYTLREPADGQWGSKVNGTWTGLVGMIAQNEADLIMAPLANNILRHEVMSFTDHPVVTFSNTVLLKMPVPSNEDILPKPFRPSTWLFIVCCFFALCLLNCLLVFFVQESKGRRIFNEFF